jgi:hypothetical protein
VDETSPYFGLILKRNGPQPVVRGTTQPSVLNGLAPPVPPIWAALAAKELAEGTCTRGTGWASAGAVAFSARAAEVTRRLVGE